MAQPIDYTVTISRAETGEIDTDHFYWHEYDNPNDLRVAVANYCNASVGLGWDVEAFDSNGKIVFTYKRGSFSPLQEI